MLLSVVLSVMFVQLPYCLFVLPLQQTILQYSSMYCYQLLYRAGTMCEMCM